VICALLAVGASGCLPARLLYSFEQPYWSLLGGNLRTRASITVDSLRRGLRPRIELSDFPQDPHARLAAMLRAGSWRTVVVGPLASFAWATAAADFPGTRFILVDVSPPQAGAPPNVTFLTFDRRDAMRSAGGEAARAARRGPGVGMLLTAGSEFRAEELQAFEEGVSAVLEGARPVRRSLSLPSDRASVKAAVAQMRGEGVAVFLLGAASLDGWALSAMEEAGGVAVVSDWTRSGASASRVLVSVETDDLAGISRALDAVPGTTRVEGPVRLVPGGARAAP
jgi:basic membrane lipoprotein Med (substrate-binding protein (PBP1-ABC) superfamily)